MVAWGSFTPNIGFILRLCNNFNNYSFKRRESACPCCQSRINAITFKMSNGFLAFLFSYSGICSYNYSRKGKTLAKGDRKLFYSLYSD